MAEAEEVSAGGVEEICLTEDSVANEAQADAVQADTQQAQSSNRASNTANLKKLGAMYGLAVIVALTLFGAAHTWAQSSGWLLALATGIAAAVAVGMVLSSILHEWGHYTGAALAGSRIKIAAEPTDYFFFLGFNPNKNSTGQALWMSCGGLVGSWSLVLGVALLVPLDSWVSVALLATVVGRAVNASVFEMPIVWRTRQSQNFKKELQDRLASPGVVKMPGLVIGLLLAVALA